MAYDCESPPLTSTHDEHLRFAAGTVTHRRADRPNRRPKANPLTSLRLRSIGPALMSGRVVGFAVHPENRSRFFVAVACGGVWKTENAGVSWTPGLRRRRFVLHRLRRPRSEKPEHRVGRHRREQQSAERRLRRRRVQVDRRRPLVDQCRPRQIRAHRQNPDRPARFGHRLRRRSRSALGPRRRSWPVQDHRRRQDLVEDPRISATTRA